MLSASLNRNISFHFHSKLSATVTFKNSKCTYFYLELILSEREREREMFYLTTHSTHFIYGYMASDIWLRTILIVRKETRCRHIGYSFRLTARVLLYAPSHRQDSTYHGLCYTSRGLSQKHCKFNSQILTLIITVYTRWWCSFSVTVVAR